MAEPWRGFLAAAGLGDAAMSPLRNDASARSYFRLRPTAPWRGHGLSSLILADASREPTSIEPFCRIAMILRDLGLSAPEIYQIDAGMGFMLVEDFGDDSYARLLTGVPTSAVRKPQALYHLAVDGLIALHRGFDAAAAADLPRFDAAAFSAQLDLFVDEMVPASDGDAKRCRVRDALAPVIGEALLLPDSLMLRDFHAGNLMLLPHREGIAALGLLDFQDAGLGPRLYDLVSLLEDARLDLSPTLRAACLGRYQAAFPDLDKSLSRRVFIALAVIRHLRVIGVFTRLARQGKSAYLDHLPRLWDYLEGHMRDDPISPALRPFRDWLRQWHPKRFSG